MRMSESPFIPKSLKVRALRGIWWCSVLVPPSRRPVLGRLGAYVNGDTLVDLLPLHAFLQSTGVG